MDDKQREFLQEELAELDKAEQGIRSARKPFDDAIMAIETMRDRLLEKHEVEIAGNCDGCARLLFTGEIGYRHEDGVLCEECAPTWAEAETQYRERSDPDDDERAFLDALEHHMAVGGEKTDKLPCTPL